MICPNCHGTGLKGSFFPCDVCEMRGVIHCCEGDCAVNDPAPPVHRAFDIKREHAASIDCWCDPVEVEDGVYLHWIVT